MSLTFLNYTLNDVPGGKPGVYVFVATPENENKTKRRDKPYETCPPFHVKH